MRRLLAAVLTAAVTGGAVACGSSAPSAPSPGPNVLVVDILRENGAQSFSPNPASPGTRMVVFRNVDSVIHRVRLNDGTLDTGNILPGQSSSPLQMPATGTNYHCTQHPTMIGAVVPVTGGEPPACEGEYCEPTP
jgi:plastocyanin